MSSSLFSPIKIGNITLNHRIVLAPLTRKRADDAHVPQNPMMKEYYSQRSSSPGTLLITEATFISAKAGLYKNAPGIYTREQIDAWKEITDAVHRNGSYIFLQLWALGRTADIDALHAVDPSFELVSASDIPLSYEPNSPHPKPLSKTEIDEYVTMYATAASNAVNKAGFDGVEIHGANGYLIDQFLQDVSNKRTDEYGGSVENRTRFALEVVKSVTDAVGEERTAFRISPWSPWQDMGMEDPIPTFTYLVSELKSRFPKLAYLHAIEARVAGISSADDAKHGSNDFIRDIWLPRPFVSAGNYLRESALELTEKHPEGQLVAFGRRFIANPDLPKRLEKDIPLNPYDRSTFYLEGDNTGRGYTDYPFAETT
ncbi:NADH:flavin oxidoreductase/NADH oxidase [Dendrothele bispora CBS 962.96]|uniref:NADH:flavin oxidoreductase/NADH oxidase n=1 Tax=Dendrothele bispora (strain CBS 962.96) TaxID=1314807 RepID=A0A4S8MJU5_DENBC|nr:NADH:flavin oxidoreductase/NADH oxidase [Dendrothele bispora CBS 962.96]